MQQNLDHKESSLFQDFRSLILVVHKSFCQQSKLSLITNLHSIQEVLCYILELILSESVFTDCSRRSEGKNMRAAGLCWSQFFVVHRQANSIPLNSLPRLDNADQHSVEYAGLPSSIPIVEYCTGQTFRPGPCLGLPLLPCAQMASRYSSPSPTILACAGTASKFQTRAHLKITVPACASQQAHVCAVHCRAVPEKICYHRVTRVDATDNETCKYNRMLHILLRNVSVVFCCAQQQWLCVGKPLLWRAASRGMKAHGTQAISACTQEFHSKSSSIHHSLIRTLIRTNHH